MKQFKRYPLVFVLILLSAVLTIFLLNQYSVNKDKEFLNSVIGKSSFSELSIPKKTIATVQKSTYGPPYYKDLYELNRENEQPPQLFALSRNLDLGKYIGKRVEAEYKEVKGVIMSETPLVLIDAVKEVSSKSSQTTNVNIYTNKKYGFELKSPTDIVDSSRGEGVLETGSDKNISYATGNMKDKKINDSETLLSFEKSWASSLCGQTELCPKVQNYAFLFINGYSAIQYSYTFKTLSGNFATENHISFLTNDKIYRFWSSTEPRFREIINTFKLIQ